MFKKQLNLSNFIFELNFTPEYAGVTFSHKTLRVIRRIFNTITDLQKIHKNNGYQLKYNFYDLKVRMSLTNFFITTNIMIIPVIGKNIFSG